MQQVDANIFHIINIGFGRPSLDIMFILITSLGIGFLQAGVGLILVLIGVIRCDVSLRIAGYSGVIAVIFAGIFSQVGKFVWDRPRPVMVLHDVRWVGEPLYVHSFPSGHTTTAFAFATAIGMMYPKTRWPLFLLASLVGLSRVYIGAHFPMDVISGAILGICVGLLAARIFQRKRAVINTTMDMGTAS